MGSVVTRIPAAESQRALAHFQALLEFETDCWDVHFALTNGRQDFVLIDVRAQSCFEAGHIEGAINIPHKNIDEVRLADIEKSQLIVVYCAGPHCNATEKAAIRLATLGRPVKKMIGGVTGWLDEGFTLV
ncbi:rhodanese-like domain-containing protein [Alteromonas sp. a30]|uniref:rhodanese-like domain-containing protein n=1 Tax=Alteromonas sp. a30 TaxID=2730917 RepID=UPI0022812DF1|nr:rhodanese-like domain-containing protein [Alteromonas sp. a30]MCY7297092.1 rhodanese-like domain-containing protein [Alteromonas sp. a30]